MLRKILWRTAYGVAGLTAGAAGVLAAPAAAGPSSTAPAIFERFYWDMGYVAAGAAAVAVLVVILRGLRDAGYLSDRWRFGEECDQD